MNAKKLSIFFGILAVLIVTLVVLNNLKTDTVYGKPSDDLYPATRDILNDSNYNNIIIPESLEKKLANKESFFVYYFSSTCPHCIHTTPLLKPVADELGINLHQYNLREFPMPASTSIESTPTIVYYKDGVETDRIIGGLKESETTEGHTMEEFKQFFNKHKPEGND